MFIAGHLYTFPTAQGSNGQMLTNNGSDTFTWTTPAGSSYFAGQGIKLTGTTFTLPATISGSTVNFQTISGTTLRIKGDPLIAQIISLPLCDGTNACATGSGAMYHVPRIMNNFFLSGATIDTYKAGTTGRMTVQLRNITQAKDMFTDGGLKTGLTASGIVLNAANRTVNAGDNLIPFVSAVHTTPTIGTTITLMFYPN